MRYPILTTKLFIPPVRADQLARPHLIDKLNEGAAYPLTLISASAGSGKTTLLAEWVTQNNRSTAWISLDRGENDPKQLLIYLISALQTIEAWFGEEVLEILQTAQDQPTEASLIHLLNEITAFSGEFTLICDDYHFITDPKTNELVAFFIEHLPPQMHLVIASRMDPPWPLARYRARNWLFELRSRDLRFSTSEAAEFLNQTMGLDLPVEDVAALETRTEGWIAGLQLAALSMRERSDVHGFVQAFAGSHLYVAEYLIEEILDQQTQEIQSFLLETSLLERLNAGLCETISDCEDGQSILQDLQRANVFVIPLDHDGAWFRYHHLFADLLRARLSRTFTVQAISKLHQRASVWYEQHGFPHEAIQHALAAEDFERAAELVKQFARPLIFSGRVNTLRDWLEAFPEIVFQTHPQLIFYLFWIDVLQSRADLSVPSIQEKENRLKELPPSPENDRLRGELMAVVCRAVALSGRTSEGIRLAQEALEYLQPENLAARARALSALATAYDLEGRPGEAKLAYQESFSQAIAVGDYRLAAHTLMIKGLAQIHYGQLHEAAKTFQSIIEMAAKEPAGSDNVRNITGSQTFFPAGQGYIGLGSIYLEWHDLESAKNYLEQGMDLCRRGGLDGIFIGKMQMSRLLQAQGDLAGALEEIQGSPQAQRVDDFNRITRQIQIALTQGDVEHAGRLAAPLVEMLDRDLASTQMPVLFFEILEAVIARVYLAQGAFEETLHVLDRLQASAEPHKRVGRLIEVHLLRALTYHQQNGGWLTPDAIESLECALALGEPEGYVLLFLEAGPDMIPLLNVVIQHTAVSAPVQEYALKLLEAFGEQGIPSPTGKAVRLVETLTPREMEVLALLASGDSNQEIAEKLVITVRTVKKHTSNIYGKLNASNRTQAVALAREFGLLPLK